MYEEFPKTLLSIVSGILDSFLEYFFTILGLMWKRRQLHLEVFTKPAFGTLYLKLVDTLTWLPYA